MIASTYAPARDGLARQTHQLSRTLVEQGVSVTALTERLPGTSARDEVDGVKVVRLRIANLSGYRRKIYPFIARMTAYLLRHRDEFDVVHVHQMTIHTGVAVALARALGKPSVVKVAGGGDTGNIAYLRRWRYSGALSLRMLKQTSRVISISEQLTTELLDAGFPVAQIVELPNGVDVERFAVPRTNDARHVMTAARLSHEKGIDILIAAWQSVATAYPHALLTILGDGPERPALEAQTRSLGIAERVAFAGEVEDVRPYLARSVFVLPSRNEGMSNALLEAMAAACPIVASDISPNRGLIQDKIHGRWFRTGDVADLAARLIDLLGDPQEAAALGARAAIAATRYSIDEVARRHRALYAEILR